jgi:hypothetical protein
MSVHIVITHLNITLAVVVLQVSRPSKYHPDWGVLLGPTTPDPTVNTSMLSIHSGSGNGSPLANGGGEAPRKPSNPNRLYISGLPYNWRTQHVSYWKLLVNLGVWVWSKHLGRL